MKIHSQFNPRSLSTATIDCYYIIPLGIIGVFMYSTLKGEVLIRHTLRCAFGTVIDVNVNEVIKCPAYSPMLFKKVWSL